MNSTGSPWIMTVVFSAALLGCQTSDVILGERGPGRDMRAAGSDPVRDLIPSADSPATSKDRGVGIDRRAAADLQARADGPKCVPAPSCNWCGGTYLRDPDGCIIGYRCANGVDPCQTMPCSQTPPTGCQPGERCGPDLLCWPSSDGGTGSTFACGALAQCSSSSQYCEQVVPGACGGSPLPDGGGCGPNCFATTCPPSSQTVCFCHSFGCKPLPVGCSDCGCIQATFGPACSCNGTPATGLKVFCGLP